jgi:hypothetical protein
LFSSLKCIFESILNSTQLIKNPLPLSDCSNIISASANIIMAFAAIVNFLLVLVFYFRDKSSRRFDEKLKSKSYWFRTIVLDKHISSIYFFFDKSKNIVVALNNMGNTNINLNDIQQKIGEFQEEKRVLIRQFNDNLRIIDDNFANRLDTSLDCFEDFFTQQVNKIFISQINNAQVLYDEFYQKINSVNQEYLKEIYEYELNWYK